MKLNLNWLAEYVDLKVSEEQLFEAINYKLGEIESITDFSLKYQGILIVKVVEVSNHPDADNLKLCLIDDNQVSKQIPRNNQGLISVVCGANNVVSGMLAVWIPLQAIVPTSFKTDQPIVMEAKNIRGVTSYGMLASLVELDLGSDAETILEVPNNHQASLIGQTFSSYYGLNTKIIEIENKMFTHRPDCFGLLGVAREIAAITKSSFKQPIWYNLAEMDKTIASDKKFRIDIEAPNLCQRLRVRVLSNAKVEPSVLELQFRLISIGIKPVNNIVDLTNYVMHLSGQPAHAFDYDKLLALSNKKDKLNLIVRQTKSSESLKLINGKTLNFDQPALVIATDKQPVALAGIMGGCDTEVDSQTKNVVLEVANFNQYDLHKTSMHYGVFSEALTRFSKGQSVWQIPAVANYLSTNISRLSEASLNESIYEISQQSYQSSSLKITPDFINQRLGTNYATKEIIELLSRVGFKVELSEGKLLIHIPFWRTDIGIVEDIVEEVGRLGGYMNIKPILPIRTIRPVSKNALIDLKTKIRTVLSLSGASEVMSYSFISQKLANSSSQNLKTAFNLINPLNPNLEVYRQDLSSSLLEVAKINIDLQFKEFAIFELGCVHVNDNQHLDGEALPIDLSRLSLIYHSNTVDTADCFYTARRYLDLLADHLSIKFSYSAYSKKSQLLSGIYVNSHSAIIELDNQIVGVLGLIKSSNKLAGFELDLDVLLSYLSQIKTSYIPISKYPKSSQDLTLQVSSHISYAELIQTIELVVNKYNQSDWRVEFQPLSIFQSDKMIDIKNISFRFEVCHTLKTVNRAEVSALVGKVVAKCSQQLSACQVV